MTIMTMSTFCQDSDTLRNYVHPRRTQKRCLTVWGDVWGALSIRTLRYIAHLFPATEHQTKINDFCFMLNVRLVSVNRLKVAGPKVTTLSGFYCIYLKQKTIFLLLRFDCTHYIRESTCKHWPQYYTNK